ncbi:MAG TPA: hypothetical protein VIQ62_12690, partial [Burkholderiales bacterium]
GRDEKPPLPLIWLLISHACVLNRAKKRPFYTNALQKAMQRGEKPRTIMSLRRPQTFRRRL